MNRTGRICRNKLKIKRFAGQMIIGSEFVCFFQNSRNHSCCRSRIQNNVDKSRTCDFNRLNPVGSLNFFRKKPGQFARIHSGFFAQLHRDISRPVSVRAVFRTHNGNLVGLRDKIGSQLAGFVLFNKRARCFINQLCKCFRTHSAILQAPLHKTARPAILSYSAIIFSAYNPLNFCAKAGQSRANADRSGKSETSFTSTQATSMLSSSAAEGIISKPSRSKAKTVV